MAKSQKIMKPHRYIIALLVALVV
ncbi:MAG: light-harvesting protein, partial [Alistipes sp.]|nr:light-harvesting protein [Alistipes sp.]